MGSKYKKIMERRLSYFDKNSIKHKHDFNIKCVLEITNKNIYATGNYYNSKEYYEVLKCNVCDSFIPISKEGNISGIIFDINQIDKNLLLIKASTNKKEPIYDFYDLFDVEVGKF